MADRPALPGMGWIGTPWRPEGRLLQTRRLLTAEMKACFRWYVADGIIRDKAPPVGVPTTAGMPRSGVPHAAMQTVVSHQLQWAVQLSGLPTDITLLRALAITGQGTITEGSNGERERVVAIRGVVWRGDNVEIRRLWQSLMRFWPSEFAQDESRPKGELLAHTGGLKCYPIH